MEYKQFGDTYFIRMDPGEEILSTLKQICQKEEIELGQIEALGAVHHAVLSVYDIPNRVFCRKEFNEPLEISNLTGTVTRQQGEVYLHLHATLCGTDFIAHGGHANELTVSATCEMVLHRFSGHVGRRFDESIGLNLYEFK